MNPGSAHIAIYAAKHVRHWGMHAAMRYCDNRNVPRRYFILALKFERGRK